MEALLKRMNEKKNISRSPSISKNPSRSMSIASSNDDNDSNSDESTTNRQSNRFSRKPRKFRYYYYNMQNWRYRECRERQRRTMFPSSIQSNNSDENYSTTSTDGESFTPTAYSSESNNNNNMSGSNSAVQPTDPMFLNLSRGSIDNNNEWQMNFFINKRDGLPKVKIERKEDKKPSWNTGPKKDPKEVKAKVGSRIDTNMVKLKLLDATRKAIIDKTRKTFNSSSTQTEHIKTKLMKDVLVDNQSDLMEKVDESTETEVELVAIKARDGNLIVTSTSAVNTDKLEMKAVASQTAMPRSNVSFKRFLQPKHSIQYEDDEGDEDYYDETKEIEEIERRLKPKRSPVKKPSIPIVVEDDDSKEIIEKIPAGDSESDYEDSIHDDSHVKQQPDIISANIQKGQSKPFDSTVNSWHDLDFPEDKPELPRTYFTDGPTPWSNFKDLVLGNRFLNARLSPIPIRERRPNKKEVTWSDTQVKVVSDLISEANALIEMFDQVAMLLGPDVKLHNVSDVEEFVMPPSTIRDDLNKSCGKIEENLQKLENLHNSRVINDKIPLDGKS